MGRMLKSRGLIPDRIVCSPALRAVMTANLLAEAVDLGLEGIEIRRELYEQGLAGLMTVIHRFDQRWSCVYLVGHNPDLAQLISRLTGEPLAHLPTCGLACLEFAIDDWAQLMEGGAALRLFDYPKRYASKA